MKGSARPHLNYKLIIGCQCLQEMAKIPNFMDSERLTPKTECALKVYKDKNSISLDSRFVDLENTGECATLRWHGSHLMEVNENIHLGYSQDQGYS